MTAIDRARLRRIGVLHEDDSLLVLDKPPGLAVHGGAGEERSLLDVLRAAYDAPPELHLVHRLDKTTSGVLCLAKSAAAKAELQRAWERAEKRYLAVVLGAMPEGGTIRAELIDDDGVARPAETRWVRRGERAIGEDVVSLVEATIASGRLHQVRRHLAGIGHPLVFDDAYGDFAANKRLARALKAAGHEGVDRKSALLHAATLVLPDGRRFEAPPPARLRQLWP